MHFEVEKMTLNVKQLAHGFSQNVTDIVKDRSNFVHCGAGGGHELDLALDCPSSSHFFPGLELFQLSEGGLSQVLGDGEPLDADGLLLLGGAELGPLLAHQNVDPKLGAGELDHERRGRLGFGSG